MPATSHTPQPTDPTELWLAERLVDYLTPDWHLWFNLQRGAMPELDLLAVHAEVGAVCIEVKGYRLEQLSFYSDDEIGCAGTTRRHPLKQVQRAQQRLMDFLRDRRMEKLPYLYLSAAFPFIDRTAMYDAFGDDYRRHFEGMLFSEDLVDPSTLTDRFRQLTNAPPLSGPARHSPPGRTKVEQLVQILDARTIARRRPTPPAVAATFRKIAAAAANPATAGERAKTKESWEKYVVPGNSMRDGQSRVVFHGKPGTGKTTDLLRISLAHALAGRNVLLCCYNKVLASELRARISETAEFAGARANLRVLDFFDLRKQLEAPSAANSVPFLEALDTICVDEAQDFEDAFFGVLREVAKEDAEWFLADSPEQMLFGERSRFVEAAVERAKMSGTWETLRLSRRPGSLVAQAALELSPHTNRISRWVEKYPLPSPNVSDELDLGVPRELDGALPDISRYSADGGWWDRVTFYEHLIHHEIQRQKSQTAHVDLAIVFVRKEAMRDEVKKVKKALDGLGLAYLDQTEDAYRRMSLERGQIRLVTAHSSRGIEADRVLLLDLDGLEGIRDNREALLNIALSRSRRGTHIVCSERAVTGTHRAFVEQLIAAYRDLRPTLEGHRDTARG